MSVCPYVFVRLAAFLFVRFARFTRLSVFPLTSLSSNYNILRLQFQYEIRIFKEVSYCSRIAIGSIKGRELRGKIFLETIEATL